VIPLAPAYASSAFTAPRQRAWVPPIKQTLACDSTPPRSLSCPRKRGRKKGKTKMSYLNSVTLVGLLVLTRSNVQRKETVRSSPCSLSRHSAPGRTRTTSGAPKPSGTGSYMFRPLLAERVATTIKKGAHRLSRQLDLRTTERQRQEVEDLEDYVVVRLRRCRAQARSR
jgi:hypothetical protein